MTVQTASTTSVTTALAAAQQEAARATLWANEAAAGRRAAKRGRDCAVATTVNLQEALAVQTAPIITAITELAAVRQDASRVTSSKIDAAHAAQSERDCALSTIVDLREELAVQTASTATATTALADAQQEGARATSWANEATEGRRAAELERNCALSTVADLREKLAVHTTSTTTATTALAAAQQGAARSTSWANEAAAGRRAAENERDRAVTATADLREELAVQTASTATATTALADAMQEAACATSWANEAAEGRRAAELERDGAFATVANLREELAVHTTSTTTVTTALIAAQQEAARPTSWANEAAAGRRAAENERDRAVTATPDLREELAVQTACTTTATTATAAAQQQAARATSWANEAATR